MNSFIRNLLVFASAALLLVGCVGAQKDTHGGPRNVTRPPVKVVNEEILVQEVLSYDKDQVDVRISWFLPADGRARFAPGNGIRFEAKADGEIECLRPSRPSLEYTCINRHTRSGKYKYEVNVIHGDKPISKDPFVWND